MTATVCPAETTLIDFSSGTLDDHQAAALEGHVTACLKCQSRIDSLYFPDPLLTSLRALSVHRGVPDELAQSLIQRLREQPVSRPGEELSQATDARQSSPKSSPASSLIRMFQTSLSAEELGRVPGYRILSELGHGGMGVVFRAEDLALHREVAIKFMHAELAFSESHAARFLREARTMAAVQSEYLVPIYSVQEYAASFGSLPFIVMPLLQGQSLWDRLQAPIQISETLQIGIQILKALRDIHRGRIIHRDLKPANIWLEYPAAENATPHSEQSTLQETHAPRVKVMDLGLVRVESEGTRLTQSGGLAGTPAYMSPEQARSENNLDHRSDLFSFGAVLYEMLYGTRAFDGKSNLSILKNVTEAVPCVTAEYSSSVPLDLTMFVLRLLSKAREDRPASAKEALAELEMIAFRLQARQEVNADNRKGPVAAVSGDVTKKRTGNKRTGKRVLPLLMGVLLTGLLVCTGFMIRQRTAHGTLVVETDDSSLDVRITQNGITLIDSSKARSFDLSAGEYEVQLVDSKDDSTVISAQKLTIQRKNQAPVHIRLERPTGQPKTPNASTTGSVQVAATAADVAGSVFKPAKAQTVEIIAARRFVDWAYSRSAIMTLSEGAVLTSGAQFPEERILHIIRFEEDPAKVIPLADRDVERFRDFPGVENSLSFRFQDFTTKGMIQMGKLIEGREISAMGLVDMTVGLDWLKEPGGFARITNATFQNISATDAQLQRITNLPRLRALNLRYNTGVTDAAIPSILKLQHLRHLHVDFTSISEAGLQRLRDALPGGELTPLPQAGESN